MDNTARFSICYLGVYCVLYGFLQKHLCSTARNSRELEQGVLFVNVI